MRLGATLLSFVPPKTAQTLQGVLGKLWRTQWDTYFMHRMRDGTTVKDPRLGRLKHQDPRSRNFRASLGLPDELVTKTWRLDERNDQGDSAACVGFGTGHRLAAEPRQKRGIDNEFSFALYRAAQKIDPWEGEDYEGTSVLAGIQAAANLGHIARYDWCFSVDDICRAVAYKGPVVVGTEWLDSMYEPRPSGLLEISGGSDGGHCYMIRGLLLSPRIGEGRIGPVFRITNSWGPGWSHNGEAFIKVEDFERHLMPGADAVVPTEKRRTS